MDLSSFDVAFFPGEKPALLLVRTDPLEASRWSLYDLDLGSIPGYKAALAVGGAGHILKCWEWVPLVTIL